MSLLVFTCTLADALIRNNKPSSVPRPVGRLAKHPLSLDNEVTPKRGRAPKSTLPDPYSRFDLVGHWPEYRAKKEKM